MGAPKLDKSQKRLGIYIIIFMILLGACGQRSETITFIQRVNYSDKELQFIEAYNSILATNGIPDEVLGASDDPMKSDFSIVLLDEKSYGTSAFSFLPLESRDLTEQEMLQLIFAYQGIEPEIILQNHCSYRSEETKTQNIYSNRTLTTEEYFMLSIGLLSEYFAEEKCREDASQMQLETYPLHYTTMDGAEVWIYPNKIMSREQLLSIIDKKYSDVPQSYYTPKEGQIMYEEAEKEVKELIENYVSDKRIDDIYMIYGSGETGIRDIPDFWTAYVHMSESNDFYLRFNADNGGLIEWKSYPKDYYSPQGFYLSINDEEISALQIDDEELLQHAQKYVEKFWKGDERLGEIEYRVESNEDALNYGTVVATAWGKEIWIYVDKKQSTVCQVRVEE